ncbi:hypothetical protein EJ04DRAFT_221769 [Polyplosphaeria fusca]|uniref:Uncharacterized protein n=1 Tax=Polyplosphaeria fusca TaxID=682080 RepID=A0A9P4R1D6_9PLEO|nr:hypothetical protein EJ04DRAFT_221769 [Polyplosphaeria fusca]
MHPPHFFSAKPSPNQSIHQSILQLLQRKNPSLTAPRTPHPYISFPLPTTTTLRTKTTHPSITVLISPCSPAHAPTNPKIPTHTFPIAPERPSPLYTICSLVSSTSAAGPTSRHAYAAGLAIRMWVVRR